MTAISTPRSTHKAEWRDRLFIVGCTVVYAGLLVAVAFALRAA